MDKTSTPSGGGCQLSSKIHSTFVSLGWNCIWAHGCSATDSFPSLLSTMWELVIESSWENVREVTWKGLWNMNVCSFPSTDGTSICPQSSFHHTTRSIQSRGGQTFSVKNQIVNIFSFMTIQSWLYSVKAPKDDT